MSPQHIYIYVHKISCNINLSFNLATCAVVHHNRFRCVGWACTGGRAGLMNGRWWWWRFSSRQAGRKIFFHRSFLSNTVFRQKRRCSRTELRISVMRVIDESFSLATAAFCAVLVVNVWRSAEWINQIT